MKSNLPHEDGLVSMCTLLEHREALRSWKLLAVGTAIVPQVPLPEKNRKVGSRLSDFFVSLYGGYTVIIKQLKHFYCSLLPGNLSGLTKGYGNSTLVSQVMLSQFVVEI